MESVEGSGAQTAAAVFFDTVARRILKQHPPPDLRGVIVVLPNYHAARHLAQALVHAAESPVLLLPEMVTLVEWAQRVRVEEAIAPESLRLAVLYQALQARRWFSAADLWSMAKELLALFDELTHSLAALPADAETFAVAVQRAYQARQNSALQFEARLVFELWNAMQSGDELDAARGYQRRLALLAQQAGKPLFVLRTADWNALEQRFLEQYAAGAAVTVCDLRGEVPATCRERFLRSALTGRATSDLRAQAAELSATSPLGESLRFFGATSLEEEARAAALQVRRWLAEGKGDIAIVAQDRVVARRVRALLERAQVLVADETGWTFATLSVSSVLDRWLVALQSDFYHHDLLDLLKSPFIFADMKGGERKEAVYRLEQLLRKRGIVAGLSEFCALAHHEPVLQQPLARLRQAAELMDQAKQRPLAGWLDALLQSLRVLGIDIGLQQDDAGSQLLQALETWQQELLQEAGRYRFAEWRRWLAQQLDSQTFLDSGIESRVRFTHLAATRCRCFDAVLLLGCDADHLPSVPDSGRWFNDAVRSSLELPTRSTHSARQRDDLLALLIMNDQVLVTWQKDRDGEPALLSPYFEMLRDLHLLTHGDDLSEAELGRLLAAEGKAHAARLPQAVCPAPPVPPESAPERISISAYNSLVACPYQFYVRHILRLNELDEVQKGVEKRDYGELVHEILRRFHERYQRASEHPVHDLEAALRHISEGVFADLVERDFSARAWLARWLRTLPGYIEWQLENENEGWHYDRAESDFDVQLKGVKLRGRVDRLDLREQEARVIDYKTQSEQLLRNKLKEAGEDVQLACYAFASNAQDAAFVSLENEKPKFVLPPHDLAQLAQRNAERLEDVMLRVRSGAGLPANGVDGVCEHCEARGVCRKGEWA